MCSNIELGFTKIDNKLVAYLYSADLTAAEFKVLTFIIRQTIGFHRSTHDLSAGFISSATGITVRGVKKVVQRLRAKGVITVMSNSTTTNIIGINPNYFALTGEQQDTVENDDSEQRYTSISEPPFTNTSEPPFTQRKIIERYKEREETPTLDDVISYCRQMSFTFSPDRFFNYYEALGWQKNGQPIMNWKAVARNWQSRERVQPVQEEVEKDDWGRPIPPKYV